MYRYAAVTAKMNGNYFTNIARFDTDLIPEVEQVFEALRYELRFHLGSYAISSSDKAQFFSKILEEFDNDVHNFLWVHGLKPSAVQSPILETNFLSDVQMEKLKEKGIFHIYGLDEATLPLNLEAPTRKVSSVNRNSMIVELQNRTGTVKQYFLHSVLKYPMDFF